MMCASLGRKSGCSSSASTRVDVDAVGLELDHPHVGAALAQGQQRAVVGRRLDDDRVARLDERLEQERVGLHRAVGDEHLRRVDAVLLGDPLAQRDVADRGPVGERAGRVVCEARVGRLREALDGRRCRGTVRRGRRRCVSGHDAAER